jgi:hypothetical protein
MSSKPMGGSFTVHNGDRVSDPSPYDATTEQIDAAVCRLRRISLVEQTDLGLPDPVVPESEMAQYEYQLQNHVSFPRGSDVPDLNELATLNTAFIPSVRSRLYVRLQTDGVWSWFERIPEDTTYGPPPIKGAVLFLAFMQEEQHRISNSL